MSNYLISYTTIHHLSSLSLSLPLPPPPPPSPLSFSLPSSKLLPPSHTHNTSLSYILIFSPFLLLYLVSCLIASLTTLTSHRNPIYLSFCISRLFVYSLPPPPPPPPLLPLSLSLPPSLPSSSPSPSVSHSILYYPLSRFLPLSLITSSHTIHTHTHTHTYNEVGQ